MGTDEKFLSANVSEERPDFNFEGCGDYPTVRSEIHK